MWSEYKIAYCYASDSEKEPERIASFTVKGRNAAEAERKAQVLMSGRAVAWRIFLT